MRLSRNKRLADLEHALGRRVPALRRVAWVVIAHPVSYTHLDVYKRQRYFSAITGLMVSQHFGRVAPHDDEAEVLRGGMLLSLSLIHI